MTCATSSTEADRGDDSRWTPRRRRANGVDLYCSPRCGGGCTWADYRLAHKDGAGLARRLGAGWTVEVWENLGWHYQAVSPCGRFKVSCDPGNGYRGSTFTAFLGDTGGHCGGTWAKTADTPEEAILAVAREAVADLHKIGAVFLDMPFEARLASPPRANVTVRAPGPRKALPPAHAEQDSA